MRNFKLESTIKNILKKCYHSIEVNDWLETVQCCELTKSENNYVANITTAEQGDLFAIREIIEKLITTNPFIKDDFKYFTMYDLAGGARPREVDMKWILEITIATEQALKVFKEAIEEIENNFVIENKLNCLYHNNFEFTQPYIGNKGSHFAEIFSDSGVDKVIKLFKKLNLEKDIIADDCDMNKGMVQVIIKTETALSAFKKAIDEKLIQKKLNLFGSNENQNEKTSDNNLRSTIKP